MRPTFIACTARSGSTLLRWLIDAHPDVSCPSETDIAQALAAAERSVSAMWGGPQDTGNLVRARRPLEDLIDAHLRERGKRKWCDKSLSNAMNLDLLARAWALSHFILLHRHVMDFIASALEASPWGLADYGFAPFAAQYPGNDVAALARYWLERTSRMLNFESRSGHRTLRIRYEDLVHAPPETMARVWTLLGVEAPDSDPDNALSSPHDAYGNADHLIWYTDKVVETSVGAGARIPADRLAGPLRREVNEALDELGYDSIDERWGAGRFPGGRWSETASFGSCGATRSWPRRSTRGRPGPS